MSTQQTREQAIEAALRNLVAECEGYDEWAGREYHICLLCRQTWPHGIDSTCTVAVALRALFALPGGESQDLRDEPISPDTLLKWGDSLPRSSSEGMVDAEASETFGRIPVTLVVTPDDESRWCSCGDEKDPAKARCWICESIDRGLSPTEETEP